MPPLSLFLATVFGLVQQIGLSVGPLVGGIAFDSFHHQHRTMWGLIAAGMAAVGVGFLVFARVWRGKVDA